MNSLRLVVILAFVACAVAKDIPGDKEESYKTIQKGTERLIGLMRQSLKQVPDVKTMALPGAESNVTSSLGFELSMVLNNHIISSLAAAKRIIFEVTPKDELNGKSNWVLTRLRAIGCRRALREYNRIKSQNNDGKTEDYSVILKYIKHAFQDEMDVLDKADPAIIALIDRRAASFGITN